MTAALKAEWTKLRTVRSTVWTLLSALVIGTGLAYLAGRSFRDSLTDPTDFDPLFATFYSLTLGQLGLVVFGVLVIGAEYSTGTIRATLIAVPHRGSLYLAKVFAATLTILGVAVVTVLATFFAAQAGLGPLGVTLTGSGVPQAVVGATVYLVLICLFAFGLTAILRSTISVLVILLPLLFLGSTGVGNIPQIKDFAQYLPDQAGMVVMHLTAPDNDPNFGRDYGPWTGLGIVALWTAAALLGGFLTMRHRDA